MQELIATSLGNRKKVYLQPLSYDTENINCELFELLHQEFVNLRYVIVNIVFKHTN